MKAPAKTGALHTEAGISRWSGKVKHRLGDSTVELFYLSALVPADIAEQMPTTLFVTELAPVCVLAMSLLLSQTLPPRLERCTS